VITYSVFGYPISWDEIVPPRLRDNRTEWSRRRSRVRRKAHELRDKLRKVLGGECVECGSVKELAFHHPRGRDWEPNRKNQLTRMRFYWRDYVAGNLSLLCIVCNGHDGAMNKHKYREAKKKGR